MGRPSKLERGKNYSLRIPLGDRIITDNQLEVLRNEPNLAAIILKFLSVYAESKRDREKQLLEDINKGIDYINNNDKIIREDISVRNEKLINKKISTGDSFKAIEPVGEPTDCLDDICITDKEVIKGEVIKPCESKETTDHKVLKERINDLPDEEPSIKSRERRKLGGGLKAQKIK